MSWPVVTILGLSFFIVTVSAAYAFFWARREGQLRGLSGAAESIFDAEEPIGVMTDSYPRKQPRKQAL